MEFNYGSPLKVVMVGDSDVGKTSLLTRLASGTFRTNLTSTVGIDYATHTVSARGTSIKLQIWDTAGQERYRALTNAYFRGAAGAVLMYDITNKKSFEHVQEWAHSMVEHGSSKIRAVMVGHKSDLEALRVVTTQEGKLLSSTYSVPFFEASSLTGTNCMERSTYQYNPHLYGVLLQYLNNKLSEFYLISMSQIFTKLVEAILDEYPSMDRDHCDAIPLVSTHIIKKEKRCCNYT